MSMPQNNPMTEGEALAVDAALDAFDEAAKNDKGRIVSWVGHSREDRIAIMRAAIAAHAAASGGEPWGYYTLRHGKEQFYNLRNSTNFQRMTDMVRLGLRTWAQCLPADAALLYTRPPAAVPADALERLDSRLRTRMAETEGALKGSWLHWQHETYSWIADELAALIPKGADHG